MKKRSLSVLQRLGRSFMLPIAILPIVGLFLGLGNSFTNEATIASLHLQGILSRGSLLYQVFTIFKVVGQAIFNNLPIIFAAAIALGMSRKIKEVAVLSSIIAFVVMHATINGLLTIDGTLVNNVVVKDSLVGSLNTVFGFYSLEMGVFGGIIVGLGVSFLNNHFCDIQLPPFLSFFEGERFIPIISTLVFVIVGLFMYYTWPPIQNFIYSIGCMIADSGLYGTFIYGVIKRFLVPFGLHHVFYLPFYQTAVGGSLVVNGTLVTGAQNIIFAQLSDSSISHFSINAARYFTGEYLIMLFGLPGAALAMYRCSDSKSKKVVGALFLSAALTSIFTGITEPIEFSFVFIAPLLYGIHVVFNGIAFVITQLFNIAIGFTFSASIIDFLVLGILQGNGKTNWIMIIPLGFIYFLLYYFSFSFCIKRFNLATPGREEKGDLTVFNKPFNFDESLIDHQSQLIVQGLGGRYNFSELDCCVTRLRAMIVDMSLINESLLKQAGAAAIMKQGESVQVIFGPKAASIKRKVDDYLAKVPANYDMIKKDKNLGIIELGNIVDGKVLPIEDCKDSLFSNKLMGDGVIIIPDNGFVVSPFDGKISMIYPTKHAIGITLDNGYEVLIHIGINTVNLKGKGFDVFVKKDQRVSKGDLLWNNDLKYIKENATDSNIIMVITNNDNMVIEKKYGYHKKGITIMEIKG